MLSVTIFIAVLTAILLNVIYAERNIFNCNAECHFAECRNFHCYTHCHCTECH
jgi:hypothetical protein